MKTSFYIYFHIKEIGTDTLTQGHVRDLSATCRALGDLREA